jgi:hypothetical protein
MSKHATRRRSDVCRQQYSDRLNLVLVAIQLAMDEAFELKHYDVSKALDETAILVHHYLSLQDGRQNGPMARLESTG